MISIYAYLKQFLNLVANYVVKRNLQKVANWMHNCITFYNWNPYFLSLSKTNWALEVHFSTTEVYVYSFIFFFIIIHHCSIAFWRDLPFLSKFQGLLFSLKFRWFVCFGDQTLRLSCLPILCPVNDGFLETHWESPEINHLPTSSQTCNWSIKSTYLYYLNFLFCCDLI